MMYTLGNQNGYTDLYNEHGIFKKSVGGFGFKTIEEAIDWQVEVNLNPGKFGLIDGYYEVYQLDGDCEVEMRTNENGIEYPAITKELDVMVDYELFRSLKLSFEYWKKYRLTWLSKHMDQLDCCGVAEFVGRINQCEGVMTQQSCVGHNRPVRFNHPDRDDVIRKYGGYVLIDFEENKVMMDVLERLRPYMEPDEASMDNDRLGTLGLIKKIRVDVNMKIYFHQADWAAWEKVCNVIEEVCEKNQLSHEADELIEAGGNHHVTV